MKGNTMIEMIVREGMNIRELGVLTPDHLIGDVVDIPRLGRLAQNPDVCDIALSCINVIEGRVGVLTFELESIRRTALLNMSGTRH